MRKVSVKILEYLMDMIFPIYCLGCGKNREELPAQQRWICPDCLSGIDLRAEQVCPICEKESEGGKTHRSCKDRTFLDGLWAAAYYNPLMEKAVHDFKFIFLQDVSFPLSEIIIRSILETQEFGELQDMMMAAFGKEEEDGVYVDEEKNKKADTLIIPVPLHRNRYNRRGFNQSFLLAKKIGEKFNLPVRQDILLRIRDTRQQSKIKDKEARRMNISGAFACVDSEEVRGKNVILVDDICTTSATLNECAKELNSAGARNVWGLVVARR